MAGETSMYRLIIIDDEPKIAEGMAQLFPWNNIGFEVVQSFFSAKDALNYLREHPVDVVLSDIQMPDMTGLELCRELLSHEEIHTVLFSSYQNYEYFRSAIQLGVGLPAQASDLHRPDGNLFPAEGKAG